MLAALKELLSSVLSVKLDIGKKSNEIVINTDELEEGKCKIVHVWSWKKMRHLKYAVSYDGGKIDISEIK
ncbi:MAG: hypothetical protein KAH86_07470 [Methanosarcinales archaeon]|nr:hypothetical protein [Methanosarcinales archaeon]